MKFIGYLVLLSILGTAWGADESVQVDSKLPTTFGLQGNVNLTPLNFEGKGCNVNLDNPTGTPGSYLEGSPLGTILDATKEIADSVAGIAGVKSASPFIPGTRNGTTQANANECPSEVTVSTSLSCEGITNIQDVKAPLMAIASSIAKQHTSILCKQNLLKKVTENISCMEQQAQIMQSQAGALSQYFSENLQRMATEFSKIKELEIDRQQQQANVGERLNGGANGAKGLRDLLKETEELVTKVIPTEVGTLDSTVKTLDNLSLQYEMGLKKNVSIETASCFRTTPRTNYRCKPVTQDPTEVSTPEYVSCMYEQANLINGKGAVDRSQLAQSQAKSRRASLESILMAMYKEFPLESSGDPQKDAANFSKNQNTGVGAATVADIRRKYMNRLKTFDTPRMPGASMLLSEVVFSDLSDCEKQAKIKTDKRISDPTDQLAQMKVSITKQKDDAQKAAALKIDQYSQQWRKNMAGLTQNHYPLSTQACLSANLPNQVSCLKDLQKNFSEMLSGNTPQSTFMMNVPSKQKGNEITFQCQGLSGCVTKFEGLANSLRDELQKVATYKSQYVMKSNQSVDAFVKQMAQTMSQSSSQLTQRMSSINKRLEQLGARPISLGAMPTEDLQKEKEKDGGDGLYISPKNPLKIIGSHLTPPMLDMSPETFNNARAPISEKNADLEKKMSEVQAKKSEAEQEKIKCERAIAKAKKEAIDRINDRLQSAREKSYDI